MGNLPNWGCPQHSKTMINLAQIIKNLIISMLDTFKSKYPRYWALIGSVFIAIETLLLTGVLPFADKIPLVVTEVIVGVVLYLTGSSTTKQMLDVDLGVTGGSVGEVLDRFLAKIVEQFKVGNLNAYSAIGAILGGFKFYLLNDPTLGWPELVVNGLLSLALLFTVPRTKPTLIRAGKVAFDEAKLRVSPILDAVKNAA